MPPSTINEHWDLTADSDQTKTLPNMSTTTDTLEPRTNGAITTARYVHGAVKWDDAGDVVSSLRFLAYRRADTMPAGTFSLHGQRG